MVVQGLYNARTFTSNITRSIPPWWSLRRKHVAHEIKKQAINHAVLTHLLGNEYVSPHMYLESFRCLYKRRVLRYALLTNLVFIDSVCHTLFHWCLVHMVTWCFVTDPFQLSAKYHISLHIRFQSWLPNQCVIWQPFVPSIYVPSICLTDRPPPHQAEPSTVESLSLGDTGAITIRGLVLALLIRGWCYTSNILPCCCSSGVFLLAC